MNWKDQFPKENRYFETENGILYKGDTIEIMKLFPQNSIDIIITDPPYGVTQNKLDIIIPFENMWEQIKRIRKDTHQQFYLDKANSFLNYVLATKKNLDMIWCGTNNL